MGFLPKDAEILPPSDDRVFKLLLTAPEAKQGLMNLIAAVIGRRVVDVVLHVNEPPARDIHEKGERFDVNCKIDDGTQINIEMQASRMEEDWGSNHENLKGKSIYYMTDLHSSQPAKGEPRYDRLARTCQITFCSYTVFPNTTEYVNSFSLRHDKTNELLADVLNITFIELSKLEEIVKKPVSEMTDLDKWSVFFEYASDPEHRESVNEVIESEEVLQMAGNLLMSISKDERERAIYRSRRKYQMDMQSNYATAESRGHTRGLAEGRAEGLAEGRAEGLAEGRTEGLAEGVEKGRLEKSIEHIRNLMESLGLPLEQAMQVLKVPEQEQARYRQLLQNGGTSAEMIQ